MEERERLRLIRHCIRCGVQCLVIRGGIWMYANTSQEPNSLLVDALPRLLAAAACRRGWGRRTMPPGMVMWMCWRRCWLLGYPPATRTR